MNYQIERAKTSKAKCVHCKELIKKDYLKLITKNFDIQCRYTVTKSICSNCVQIFLENEILKMSKEVEKITDIIKLFKTDNFEDKI